MGLTQASIIKCKNWQCLGSWFVGFYDSVPKCDILMFGK